MFVKTTERPILAMQQWYVDHPDLHTRTFLEDYDALAVNGYVLSTPKLFICAHPVRRDAEMSLIENPMHVFAPEDCDCWFVDMGAGDLSRIWDYFPIELPFAMWNNRGIKFCVAMERIRGKLDRHGRR
jgi:hypothetical protein